MQKEKPVKMENIKIKKEKLYRLNKLGLKIRRIRDKSIRTRWSWLFGHKYELKK